jgi:deoxyribodipyrimidine photo-lyase
MPLRSYRIQENSMIHPARIKILNNASDASGSYVVYWMQQSQRIEYNHALAYGIELANSRKLPLLVFFSLTDNFPDANLRP